MAPNTSFESPFNLDANQQDLLVAALNSASNTSASNQRPSRQVMSQVAAANGSSNSTSPVARRAPDSSGLEGSLESPYLDYDQELDFDIGLDMDNTINGQMIGSLPGEAVENDLHDKRKSLDGEGANEEGRSKRQETDERKKPGRRPLTSEPTTKRKAQNRAAQRAFRERKEKHLKDLEDKVEDLEKASASANQENSLLKAQVKSLQTELQEYRQRLASQPVAARSTSGGYSRPSWDNITFDFPTFQMGANPASSQLGSVPKRNTSSSSNSPSATNGNQPQRSASYGSNPSVFSQNQQSFSTTPSSNNNSALDAYAGFFSPSAVASMSPSSDFNLGSVGNRSRDGSLDNALPNSVPNLNGGYAVSNSASPSASSVSQHGPGSSTGTSPEPSGNSATIGNQQKPVDTSLKTISEEAGSLTVDHSTSGFLSKTPSTDINSFAWLAQQNDGQFNPDLFNEYRDPQDAITTNDYSGFFNEAFSLPEFSGLGNEFSTPLTGTTSITGRRDILSETDAVENGEIEPVIQQQNQVSAPVTIPNGQVSQSTSSGEMLKMNQIWDTINRDKKVQSGECDIDSLCKEMTKKAKCTESGLKVPKKDVDEILKKGTNGMFDRALGV